MIHVYHILDVIKTVIFDWKRTLYDPDGKNLIDGAKELLEFIKSKNISMILVGKGSEDMNEEVDRLGVKKYFKEVIFAEGEKNLNVFIPYISKENPKRTIFIGDRVRSELEIGNRLGVTTIWVKQGKFAREEPENEFQRPDYTVYSLRECVEVLKPASKFDKRGKMWDDY